MPSAVICLILSETEQRPECSFRIVRDVPLVEFMYLVFTHMPG